MVFGVAVVAGSGGGGGCCFICLFSKHILLMTKHKVNTQNETLD